MIKSRYKSPVECVPDTPPPPQLRQAPPVRAKAVIACTCSEVTLDEFTDCLFRGNLRRLARSGTPAQEQLSAAWEQLYEEFSRLTEGAGRRNLLMLSRRVAALEAKLGCAAAAMLTGGEKANSILREIGYPEGMEGLQARVSRDSITLEELRRELSQAQKEAKGDTGVEENFTRWINAVGKYMGFRVDRKTVSVAEFIDMDKMMAQELREAKKLRKNGR